ncbi:MAG: CDP-diacylglycerol--serine O-phosphatidyltransferase [Cyclobacteriaceae bacterium]|nr:CDP-diacylglycerol--serine O-phosphatidyltransferase [Cyclobacteriaceae bacterium]
MKLLRHLPNALTCGNLLCGCVGIVFTLHYSTGMAIWFVMLACVFDFFDGFAARMLKVTSPIGKELDSLADMVSFGALPAVTMFQMIDVISANNFIAYSSFSLAVFSALRLAKFNIDENQKDSFTGVPTPANALLSTSLVYLKEPWDMLISQDYFLVIIVAVSSFLLVSPWELFALKFKNFTWSDNKLRFTFLGLSVLLLAFWQIGALPFVILLYVLLSLLTRWVKI